MSSEAAMRADRERRASHRAMFKQPPYTQPCPRCDAAAGASCRRPDGVERPAHNERVALYDPEVIQLEIGGI
jgi:hypothetical protein